MVVKVEAISITGIGGQVVLIISRPHGDHGFIITGRKTQILPTVIAGCRYNGYPALVGKPAGGLLAGRRATAAQAHVDDIGSHVGGIVDSVDNPFRRSPTPLAQHLDRYYGHIWGHPGAAQRIIGGLGNGAGHMSAMPFIIIGVFVSIDEITAAPEIGPRQIRGHQIVIKAVTVLIIILVRHTGINHRHLHRGITHGDIPGGLNIQPFVDGIIEVPLIGVLGVIGDEGSPAYVVRLRVNDLLVSAISLGRRMYIRSLL